MSAKRSEFGVRHTTVVPSNFTPDEDEEPTDGDAAP
jgi:hypothetical protein